MEDAGSNKSSVFSAYNPEARAEVKYENFKTQTKRRGEVAGSRA